MSVSIPARQPPRLYDSQHEQHAGLRFGVAARAEEFIPTSCKPPCFVGQEHARRYLTALMNRGISPALQVAPSIRQFLLPAEEDGCRSVVRVSSFTFGARIFGGPGRRIASGPAFPQTAQTKQTRARDRSNKCKACLVLAHPLCIRPNIMLFFICCVRISGNK